MYFNFGLITAQCLTYEQAIQQLAFGKGNRKTYRVSSNNSLGDNSREAIISNIGSDALNILFYYIDTSILLENIPHVKFIKTTSGTRVVYFP